MSESIEQHVRNMLDLCLFPTEHYSAGELVGPANYLNDLLASRCATLTRERDEAREKFDMSDETQCPYEAATCVHWKAYFLEWIATLTRERAEARERFDKWAAGCPHCEQADALKAKLDTYILAADRVVADRVVELKAEVEHLRGLLTDEQMWRDEACDFMSSATPDAAVWETLAAWGNALDAALGGPE